MNQKNNQETWRSQHPITLTTGINHNDFNRFIPTLIKKNLHNIINSPEDRYRDKKNAELGKNQEKKNQDSMNNSIADVHANLKSDTSAKDSSNIAPNQGESSSSTDEIQPSLDDQKLKVKEQSLKDRELLQEQLDTQDKGLKPVARLVQEGTDPGELTMYAQLHCPCNSQFDVQTNFQSTLNFDRKSADINFVWRPPIIQEISTPSLLQAALRTIHVNRSLESFGLTTFVTFSTTGQKCAGIRTTFGRQDKNYAKSDNSSNNNTENNEHVISPQYSSSHVMSPQSSSSLDNSSLNQSSLISTQSSTSANTSEPNQNSFLGLKEEFVVRSLKNASIDSIVQSLFQGAKITVQKKQIAYLLVGVFFITGRLIALRILKIYRIKNETMDQKEFIEKTKVINFVISTSTDLSTIATSFVCYPIASNLMKGWFESFLYALKLLSYCLPENFFVRVFCFLDTWFLLSAFSDVISFAFTLGICGVFRTAIINILEPLINFLIEQICRLFAFMSSSIDKLTDKSA